MLGLVELLATLLATALLSGAAVLAVEIAAALFATGERIEHRSVRNRCDLAILVPAHNEELGLGATLDALRRQMREGDRVLVVADNCTDGTAALARARGVAVAERNDPARRGKGYALSFGVDCLRREPPDAVVILDADCRLGAHALDKLAEAVASAGRPVQALDLIEVETDAPIQQRISAFAFRVKNDARFSGLSRLGLPCPLAGTGMAFPWSILEGAPLATGDIVEDIKLGIELAIAGHPAVFERRALVTSRFPATDEGERAQRRRWEHGHLRTMFREAPRLLYEAVRQGRAELMGMALDLLVPPLSFLVLATALSLALSAGLVLFGGGHLALALSAVAAGLTASSLLLAWHAFGRDLLSPRDLVAIPAYVVRKIPMYLRVLYKREKDWIRGFRQKADGGS